MNIIHLAGSAVGDERDIYPAQTLLPLIHIAVHTYSNFTSSYAGIIPQQLVATADPDEQRIGFWPRLIHSGGRDDNSGWMDRLCSFCGIWNPFFEQRWRA